MIIRFIILAYALANHRSWLKWFFILIWIFFCPLSFKFSPLAMISKVFWILLSSYTRFIYLILKLLIFAFCVSLRFTFFFLWFYANKGSRTIFKFFIWTDLFPKNWLSKFILLSALPNSFVIFCLYFTFLRMNSKTNLTSFTFFFQFLFFSIYFLRLLWNILILLICQPTIFRSNFVYLVLFDFVFILFNFFVSNWSNITWINSLIITSIFFIFVSQTSRTLSFKSFWLIISLWY